MKQSINLGGVKDLSMSLLRVLSGAPKCTTLGATSLTYKWNLVWDVIPFPNPDAGRAQVNLHLADPNNNTAPPCKPHGKWVAVFTANITHTVPTVDVDGNAVNTQFGYSLIEHPKNGELPTGRPEGILAGDNAWSIIKLADNFPDPAVHRWLVPPGPELKILAFFDFSIIQSNSQHIAILLEQNDLCSVLFYPNFRAVTASGPFAGQISWNPMANGFGIFDIVGVANHLNASQYPDGTIMGDLSIHLIRVDTTPLFTWTPLPPLGIAFNNLTFFNPAINPTWLWDFGDGTTSTLQNPPRHDYAQAGKYHVVLTVTDLTGTAKVFDQIVNLELKANFSFTGSHQTIFVNGVLTPVFVVIFTDNSIGQIVAWDWDFGDGSPHDRNSVPLQPHVYNPVGKTYQVTLKVTDIFNHTASVTKPLTA